MNTFFLSKKIPEVDSNPLIFMKNNNLLGNFLFTKALVSLVEGPGLTNDVLISNAGFNNLNGIFNFVSDFNGKPYYNKLGDPRWFILWNSNEWEIYDFEENIASPIYFSSENVLYPWNVINWSVLNPIYNPLPIVTKII